MLACDPQPAAPDPTPDAEAVIDEPRAYAGREVAVEGVVDRVLSDCALRLASGDGWIAAGPLFTVCETQPPHQDRVDSPAPGEGDYVQVRGTTTEMTRVTYEQRAAVTVDSEIWGHEDSIPVLMASSIKVLERDDERFMKTTVAKFDPTQGKARPNRATL